MRRILAATDGSEGGSRAVDMAAALAKGTGAALVAITVADRLEDEAEVKRLAQVEGGVGEALDLIACTLLREARQRAHAFGVSSFEGRQASGDPAEAIIKAAREVGAEIIVVGRRGRGRLAGLLLGSVSQKLVALAPCATLVVP